MTDWLARARAEGTPLIDGEQVTFVWQGDHAPTLRSDLTGWWPGATPWQLRRVQQGVWVHSVELPLTAYLEYAFFDGPTRRPDPFNPHTAPGYGNNYVFMPDAPRPAWEPPRPNIPVGQVIQTELTSRLLTGGKRGVRLYTPPVSEPVPLLVVFDGQEYFERARLPAILDHLQASGDLPPLAAVMVDNHPQARVPEYACSEATLGFLVHELLPWAKGQTALLDTPGGHGVVGSSMGGLMALYAGLRRPDLFGHVLAQSGAFGGRDESIVFSLLRSSAPRTERVYQSVGTFEWLLTVNRRLREVLVQQGYTAAYREFTAGHNYTAWAADLTPGLTWLYGRSLVE